MVAAGEVQPLIGILGKLDGLSTAVVDRLDFSRIVVQAGGNAAQGSQGQKTPAPVRAEELFVNLNGPGQWLMTLDLTVVYGEAVAAQKQGPAKGK